MSGQVPIVSLHPNDYRHCSFAAVPLRRWAPPRQLLLRANKDGKGGSAEPSKADFSAYWSMKFKELFSARRKYLQSGRTDEDPEPVKKIKEREKLVRAATAPSAAAFLGHSGNYIVQLSILFGGSATALPFQFYGLRGRAARCVSGPLPPAATFCGQLQLTASSCGRPPFVVLQL